jgi:hypothetical protein
MMRLIANYLARKQGSILQGLLALIVALFIGILVSIYFIAREANPILLDEHGKPINAHQMR